MVAANPKGVDFLVSYHDPQLQSYPVCPDARYVPSCVKSVEYSDDTQGMHDGWIANLWRLLESEMIPK